MSEAIQEAKVKILKRKRSVVVESSHCDSDEDQISKAGASGNASQEDTFVQLPNPAVFKPALQKLMTGMFRSTQWSSSDVGQGMESYADLIECNRNADFSVAYMHPRCPRLVFSSSNHHELIIVAIFGDAGWDLKIIPGKNTTIPAVCDTADSDAIALTEALGFAVKFMEHVRKYMLCMQSGHNYAELGLGGKIVPSVMQIILTTSNNANTRIDSNRFKPFLEEVGFRPMKGYKSVLAYKFI